MPTTGQQRHQIADALVDVRAIRAWADAQEAGLVGQLTRIESFPEATIAEAGRCSVGAASKTKERSDTLSSTPTLAEALEHGAITAGHVDSVTQRSKKLDDDAQRQAFLDRANALSDVATAGTIEQFGKRLDLEVKRLQADDGEALLTRQQRNTRMSTWTDAEGMWNVRGRFDPVTAVRLAARLDSTVQTLFAKETPALCPSDPVEKSKFLTAHAFIHLVAPGEAEEDGTVGEAGAAPGTPAPTSRRPEYVAVIDADAPGVPGPAIEFSIPVEMPRRVLAQLAGEAEVIGVVVRNGVVLYAPGELNLGRSTRLANRAPAPGVAGAVSMLCDPRLLDGVRPLQAAPRHLVAPRRTHRPRQPAPRVCGPPREDPQRRVGRRTRPEPGTHAHVARRTGAVHGPAESKIRRLTPPGRAPGAADAANLVSRRERAGQLCTATPRYCCASLRHVRSLVRLPQRLVPGLHFATPRPRPACRCATGREASRPAAARPPPPTTSRPCPRPAAPG